MSPRCNVFVTEGRKRMIPHCSRKEVAWIIDGDQLISN